jgi:glycolate oxidase FAD binding subunit
MASDSCGTRIMTAVTEAGSIQETILDSLKEKTPLRIAGRSTWIDAGRSVEAARILSTATNRGVVDYVPGDLTITVRGGTTLREIDEATRAEGQWFPLDPFGSSEGTIAATIATGSFGSLATGFGRARDLVLGVEFITGEGKLVRGGGRVVKNVAGYDLVRLITGSWGTLGVITEATLRLYALPRETLSLSLGIPDGAGALKNRIASVLNAPGSPFAVEVVNATAAERIGLAPEPQLMVRLGGNSAAVTAQRAAISQLGGARVLKAETWDRLRVIEDGFPSPPVVLRISSLPATIAETWIAIRSALREIPEAMMHATPSLGIVRCVLPASAPLDVLEHLSSLSRSVIHERLSAAMWSSLSPSVVSDRLSQGIKRAFDPSNILNPGILGPLT